MDADARSLLRLAPVLRGVQIEAPRLRLAHLAASRYDIDDILAHLAARPAPAQPEQPARFALYSLQLSDGEVRFDDRPLQRQHEVSALQIALPALDRVARALADRPALRLTVSGSADAVESEALRAELLRLALQDEHRRERVRAGAAAEAASALPEAGSAAYAALVERLYTRTALPEKPRNLLGMAKTVPPPQMQAMLRAAMPLPADAWRELALRRGLVVRDALIARGLASERLFLGAPKPREAVDPAQASWTPHATLVPSPP